MSAKACRPIPTDLADNIALSISDLAKLYRCGKVLVYRWIEEAGLSRQKAADKRVPPVPAGYKDIAHTAFKKELAERYGVTKHTIRNWDAQCGITSEQRYKFVRPPKRKPAPARPASHRGFRMEMPVLRIESPAEKAATFLRAYGPVSRCMEDGRLSQGGRWWRVGSLTLTDAALIARAEEKKARDARLREYRG